MNATAPLTGLTDAVHFDANALDIIFPLTFGLDTTQVCSLLSFYCSRIKTIVIIHVQD